MVGRRLITYTTASVLWLQMNLFPLVQLRLMNSELVVEDVVKDRSMKVRFLQFCCQATVHQISPLQVFRERCWKAYKPPDL